MERKLGGRYWRAKLQLDWPSKVSVSAVHPLITTAEENVYLLACDLLKNIGLVYQPYKGIMLPVSQDHILKILTTLHSSTCHPFSNTLPQFHITTQPTHITSNKGPSSSSSWDQTRWKTEKAGKRNRLWCTDVSASWPYPFDISSFGPTSHASKYSAALHTSIKLKALGLLSSDNCLALSRLPSIAHRQRFHVSREQFNPHYEIYSDASASGFGAYLLKKDDHHVHWLANKWSEHFPDCPRIIPRRKPQLQYGEEAAAGVGGSGSVQLESTFCELYSVVTACFTWKHKFVGKRVLVWTDNMAIVHMLNGGLHGEAGQQRWGKLFDILASTSRKYSIELRASHVHRSQNTAADLLSRCHLSAFKAAVPEATPCQKKTKKLLFWNPLQLGKCSSSPDQPRKFL
ncbi:uncharacterized protein LOC143299507 isoform X2 [Babylonia areolata]